ncbi:MAG: LamG domain-containing protein [Desulfobacterales bacterium]|nr:LamG domain-containing protein [Desulfobacterales bacterium]
MVTKKYVFINIVFFFFSMFLIATTVYGDQSLIGHWQFDEGDGTIASDASTLGNNGFIYYPEWIEGYVNNGLAFNGENSYVEVPYNEAYNAQVFTAAMWLKSENGSRTCAYLRRSGGWHIRTSNGQWDIALEGSGVIQSGYYFPDQEWHHYAVTVDNINKTVTFFVDGKQFGNVHSYSREISASTGNFYIGQYSGNYRWKGGIDDVRLYNEAKSEQEIREIFLKDSDLIGYWPLDEISEGFTTDISGLCCDCR